MRFSIGFFAVIGAKLRADSSRYSCKYHDISNVNTFRRFPAVFNGTISVSGWKTHSGGVPGVWTFSGRVLL